MWKKNFSELKFKVCFSQLWVKRHNESCYMSIEKEYAKNVNFDKYAEVKDWK